MHIASSNGIWKGERAVADCEHKVIKIAEEIETYLFSHPNAADTVEGITKWWLTRQRYEEATALVRKALDNLIARGSVVQSTTAAKQCIYRKTKKKNLSNCTQ